MQVEFTSEFKRNIRRLLRKYPSIRVDVQAVVDRLAAGEIVGNQIPRIGYTVFKVRIRNSDIKKGQRSGYRLIYYLQTEQRIILITIYSKTEQGDISAEQIRRVIETHS